MDGASATNIGRKTKRQLKRGKSSTHNNDDSVHNNPSNETATQTSNNAYTPEVESKDKKEREHDDKTETYASNEVAVSSEINIADLQTLVPFDSSVALSGYELAGLGILNTLQDLGSQEDKEEVAPTGTSIQQLPTLGAFDPFRQDEDGDTILHLSIVQEDESLSELLVSRMKPRLDIYNKLRQTPLHLAVITKNINLIKLLILNGADVNIPDRNGQTSIHLAVKTKELLYPQTILDTLHNAKAEIEPVDLEIRNYDGLTSLHLATLIGNCDIIGHLLAHGANIESKDSKSGRTSLHHAVEGNNQTVVEYLLKHGADANAKTYAGNIALHTASGRNMEDVYRLLLTYGSDVNLKNIEGDSPRIVSKQNTTKTKEQKKGKTPKKKN